MPLLDYTTSISPFRTIGELQETLVAHGARKILTEYSDAGKIIGLSFVVETSAGMIPIRLPVAADKVQKILERQKAPKRDLDQAERVAWRNIFHWVVAQMALVETSMVTLDQVMLPYVTQQDGKTLYQAFQENQYRLTGGNEFE
jgi:hypothetical protein